MPRWAIALVVCAVLEVLVLWGGWWISEQVTPPPKPGDPTTVRDLPQEGQEARVILGLVGTVVVTVTFMGLARRS